MKLLKFKPPTQVYQLSWVQAEPGRWYYGVFIRQEVYFHIAKVTMLKKGDFEFRAHGFRASGGYESLSKALKASDHQLIYGKCQVTFFKDLDLSDVFWCNWLIWFKIGNDENKHHTFSPEIRSNSQTIKDSHTSGWKAYIAPQRKVVKLIP